MLKLMTTFVAAVFGCVLATSAAATTLTYSSCTTAQDQPLMSTTGCEIGTGPKNGVNDSVAVVNSNGGFFGHNDWAQISKDESANGTGQSGNLDVDFGTYGEVLAIFKSGVNYLVGYTITSSTGSWTSPFPGKNGNFKDLSHLTYYGRGQCTDPFGCDDGNTSIVPVPASLPLLATAFLGAGIVARRRRKAA